jgi:hypothetical protein
MYPSDHVALLSMLLYRMDTFIYTGDKVVFGKSRAGKRLAKLGQKGLVFV